MKNLKALSLSLAAAAAFAGTASAQTVVHISGSTAFRAPATAAMIDYLNSTSGNGVYAGYTGSSLLGAANAIIANGTVGAGGTATIEIETYWTGSLAGVVDLVAGNDKNTQYLDPSVIGAASITAINNGGVPNVTVGSANNSTVYAGGVVITPTAVQNNHPDLAFTDGHKATVAAEVATGSLAAPIGAYSSIATLAAACSGGSVVDSGDPSNPGNSLGANAFNDGLVGVVPFEWVSGNGAFAAAGVTNITQQAAKTLFTQGSVLQSLLTGTNNPADTTNSFYVTGRNEDSGTRIGYLMESQFGVTASPKQYTSAFALFAAGSALNTEPNISWAPAGHSGYNTGGNVSSALIIAETAPKFLVSCLGITDATTAINGGGKSLTYGGVPFSIANVQNGLYTIWTYEHAYHLSTLGAGPVLTAVNAIADNVHNTDADIAGNGKHSAVSGDVSAGILYDANFNVNRPLQPEGGPISHF